MQISDDPSVEMLFTVAGSLNPMTTTVTSCEGSFRFTGKAFASGSVISPIGQPLSDCCSKRTAPSFGGTTRPWQRTHT